MMIATIVDGERLVRAWRRFRDRFPEEQLTHDHRDMLEQYAHLAQFYEKAAATPTPEDHDEWVRLLGPLTEIANESQLLVNKRCTMVNGDSGFRIPTQSELLQRRRKLTTDRAAAKSQNAPRPTCKTFPTSPPAATSTEFTHDDFRSMLAPRKEDEDEAEGADLKLSTTDIRRRLGLHDRGSHHNENGTHAGEQTTTEAMAREQQESIQSDMAHLAHQLKQRTKTINESLVEDVKILDAVSQSAESNAELLERENAVLKRQLASSIGLWTSLWLVMAAVMVFMAMYIYIKLFSRRL